MLNLFLKLIAAATAAAIAEALLPDGGAKGGIAGGAMKLISFALAAQLRRMLQQLLHHGARDERKMP